MPTLAKALKDAQKQGLISIRGIERDLQISRNTVRSAMGGQRRPRPVTEAALWQYLSDKGAL